jgi:glycosyltransferase involved in cell wall biosynthesis
MFAANAVDPTEIRLIHHHLQPGFDLLIGPDVLNLSDARISIIVRTLNETRHLEDLLNGIACQLTEGLSHEVIVVDSGSTDGTLELAERHGCVIRHIARDEFSFGRSLNIGCETATGDLLVIISGHCVPVDEHWLINLVQPLIEGRATYTYGQQLGGPDSHFSECRIYGKYYPDDPARAQNGFFCNNANAALLQQAWATHRFDEELTGLEDMELAQRLVQNGGNVLYVPTARVYHHHDESWRQVRRRYEREAIALQRIMPQVHINRIDAARYIASSVWKDWRAATRDRTSSGTALDILRYRWNQYVGAYKGNHQHRKLSHAEKEKYFFPD